MTARDDVPASGGLHPLAIVVAVALHVSAGVGLLYWHRPLLPPADPYSIDVQLDPVAPPEPEVAEAAPQPQVQPDPPPEPEATPVAEEIPPPQPEAPLEVLMAMLPLPEPPDPVEIAPLDLPRPPVPPPPEKPRPPPRPRPVAATPPSAATTNAATDATAPAAPAPPAAITPDWQGRLSAWLMSHRYYPEAARRRGEHGTVVVRFTVAADGTVTTVSLVKGAGSAILDEAALGMLRGARVPPFPSSMAQASVTVAVPIRYALEH